MVGNAFRKKGILFSFVYGFVVAEILALLGLPGKEDRFKLLRRGPPGDRESCDVSELEVVMEWVNVG
jgi:hypothetical protein